MKRRPTRRSPEAERTIRLFREQHLAPGQRCWLCETRQANHPHHIIYRRGDMYDDLRNLLAVCWLCHARIHDGPQTLVGGRVVLPEWTRENVERAKRRWDADNWDPQFLDSLAHPERTLREFFNGGQST
jgi:hypothetical protein